MELHEKRELFKLTGNWNTSELVVQLDSLSSVHQCVYETGNILHIDCSEIQSVDMTGLQLLYAWMQCVSIRGAKPVMINLPQDMQQSIKLFGFEKKLFRS